MPWWTQRQPGHGESNRPGIGREDRDGYGNNLEFAIKAMVQLEEIGIEAFPELMEVF